MKLQTLAAACAALVSLTAAGSAYAASDITVKLQQPVAAKTKIIAGGVMFVCEADACTAAAPSTSTFGPSACKTLAKTVGPVAAFADARKSLDEARLAQCNAAAAPATQVANR